MESFFGHLKEELKREATDCLSIEEVMENVYDYIDYNNNGRYQWDFLKKSPRKHHKHLQTGKVRTI